MKLIQENELQSSNTVANCLMNRERQAFGENSYQKDIYLNPYNFLKDRINKDKARWLDLCCGQGKAMIQVMSKFSEENIEDKFELLGVDLVSMFDPCANDYKNLNFIESPLGDFETEKSFDLITCVHGLHYIGDKLEIILKYIQYLKKDGIFIGNLDTNNILDENGKKLGRKINSFLRKNSIEYDTRKKIVKCNGNIEVKLPFQYLGADDKFGKNYTGQRVVSSYYKDLK